MLPKGFKIKSTSSMQQQSVEIIYTNDNDIVEFRTAKVNDDISSDTSKYELEKTTKLSTTNITLKGNNKLINVATWVQDDMSYCILAPNGLVEDDMLNMVKSIA